MNPEKKPIADRKKRVEKVKGNTNFAGLTIANGSLNKERRKQITPTAKQQNEAIYLCIVVSPHVSIHVVLLNQLPILLLDCPPATGSIGVSDVIQFFRDDIVLSEVFL